MSKPAQMCRHLLRTFLFASLHAVGLTLMVVVGNVLFNSPSPTQGHASAAAAGAVAKQGSLAPSLLVTVNIDSAYAYLAPDWNSGQIGRVMKWQTFIALARNPNGEWLQVDFGNNLAWLHRSMVRFAGDLEGLNAPALAALPVRETAGGLSPSRVRMATPGVPTITPRARQLYRQAVAAGRDPNLFTVAGDCNSEPQVYLGRFAAGGFDLAGNGFAALQPVAKKFARSFERVSLAVDGGHNSASVLDPLFSNAQQCRANESPLACELRRSNASIIFIALGTGDTFIWQDFEANYRRIIDTVLEHKALPVLVTKADSLESTQGGAPPEAINNVIRRLGAQYQLPVMDFALAARRLPDQGLAEEGREIPGRGLVYAAASRFHLNGYGMDLRLVMTLMTLNAVAR
ncbi:MAG: SGNH/GDSL hydrolase family protein [Anaerolineae bacterium]|nr:SGNH/GDSL hydrolase family protein [Thermoflexales bacterium]MDW8406402.1 SGNH/GDSL hydrolase family protein [Anaerolineae bacterium]